MEHDPYRLLLRIGAVAAFVVLALVPVQVAVYALEPPPPASAVEEWFALLGRSPLLGLLHLDLLLIVDNLLVGLTFLAIVLALRSAKNVRSLVVLGGVLEAGAVVSYFASNVAFQMLELHERLVVAGTEAERAAIRSAGHAMLATMEGSAFVTGYVLSAFALVAISIAMLRTRVFGKPTAWAGLAFGVLSLVPASFGTLGLVFSLASLLPMVVWLALVGRRLLSSTKTDERPRPALEPAADLPPRLPVGA